MKKTKVIPEKAVGHMGKGQTGLRTGVVGVNRAPEYLGNPSKETSSLHQLTGKPKHSLCRLAGHEPVRTASTPFKAP